MAWGEYFPVKVFIQQLFQTGVYKRSQGRISRQVTGAAVGIVLAWGLYRLSESLIEWGPQWQFGLSGALLLVGLWFCYRLVNVPVFADFLIAVEAEMNKVSWPTRHELFRGSAVVLITILFLAVVLFGFDAMWRIIFTRLGIL
jgi:preprotein translocase subunit SecE